MEKNRREARSGWVRAGGQELARREQRRRAENSGSGAPRRALTGLDYEKRCEEQTGVWQMLGIPWWPLSKSFGSAGMIGSSFRPLAHRRFSLCNTTRQASDSAQSKTICTEDPPACAAQPLALRSKTQPYAAAQPMSSPGLLTPPIVQQILPSPRPCLGSAFPTPQPNSVCWAPGTRLQPLCRHC